MKNLVEQAKKIRCVICDVDGVLTDGKVFFDHQGNELKGFDIQDGFGLKLLMSIGIEIAIITGSVNPAIDYRMKQLDIQHYFKGKINKLQAYQDLKLRLNIPDEAFAYIGDDLPDLVVMRQVGLSVAVANAVDLVKENAHWNTELSGGNGAVREVCNFILNSQGKLDEALERFLAK